MKGTHQCDFTNFWGSFGLPTKRCVLVGGQVNYGVALRLALSTKPVLILERGGNAILETKMLRPLRTLLNRASLRKGQ